MSVKGSSIKNTVCIDNFIQQHIIVVLLDAPIMFHIILTERTTGASVDFKVCKRAVNKNLLLLYGEPFQPNDAAGHKSQILSEAPLRY